MQIGRQITKLRTAAGLSQSELAEKLFVSRDLVSKWETGKRRPEYKTILKMAEIFSVQPDTIIDKDAVLREELAAAIPARFSDGDALQTELNAFLATLSERDRCVFIRRYYFLDEPNEIGEKYGIKENYVRTILMRVRKKLKKHLKEESL